MAGILQFYVHLTGNSINTTDISSTCIPSTFYPVFYLLFLIFPLKYFYLIKIKKTPHFKKDHRPLKSFFWSLSIFRASLTFLSRFPSSITTEPVYPQFSHFQREVSGIHSLYFRDPHWGQTFDLAMSSSPATLFR